MGNEANSSGPQFRANRGEERAAVRTTIVGGRPPGSGQEVGDIPRGLEVLIKKASVDADFKQLLLDQRAAAADSIGLSLSPPEAMMLQAIPAAQLEATIARTRVPTKHRRAFLGHAAAAMLATFSLSAGCKRVMDPPVGGADPNISTPEPPPEESEDDPEKPVDDSPGVTRGIRPDRIMPAPGGAAPDRPPPKD